MTLIMFFSFLSVSEQYLVILVLLKYYQNVKGISFYHFLFIFNLSIYEHYFNVYLMMYYCGVD